MQTPVIEEPSSSTVESEPLEEIGIVRIMSADIRPSRSVSGSFEVPLELTILPDSNWVHAFRQTYSAIRDVDKREALLAGFRVIVTVGPQDDLQKATDAIKQAVEEANEMCRGARQEKAREDTEQRQHLRDEEAILEGLRERARRVKI